LECSTHSPIPKCGTPLCSRVSTSELRRDLHISPSPPISSPSSTCFPDIYRFSSTPSLPSYKSIPFVPVSVPVSPDDFVFNFNSVDTSLTSESGRLPSSPVVSCVTEKPVDIAPPLAGRECREPRVILPLLTQTEINECRRELRRGNHVLHHISSPGRVALPTETRRHRLAVLEDMAARRRAARLPAPFSFFRR
jgi:hypothetical protein